MTSGIYKLTFKSGDTYIGKSKDVPNRWKQHFENFNKGKAAKNMQLAFSRYGFPGTEILHHCHPDHLDILEGFYINRHSPSLNTTIPSDPFAGMTYDEVDKITELLDKPSVDLLMNLNSLYDGYIHLKEQAELNLETLKAYQVKRSEEEIERDTKRRILSLNNKIDSLTKENSMLHKDNGRLEKALIYAKLPWWKKLFM